MNKSIEIINLDSGNIKNISLITLDGREIEITPGINNKLISSDGESISINFSWLNKRTSLGASLFRVIAFMASTHSLRYVESICRAFSKWFEACNPYKREELDLSDLEYFVSGLSSNLPTVYLNFVVPVLRRLVDLKFVGLNKDLEDWINDGYSYEEKGNGAYFTLVTNDPERGALTTQELNNIQSLLNKAYSNGEIHQKDFVIAWFLIATGVRPVQISRMQKKDIRIEEGPEGKEVTLMIPLAKGQGIVDQGKWAR
jgi:hypothetical protein